MPEIAAANVATAVKAASSAADSSSAPATDATAAGPFAAVLQRQMGSADQAPADTATPDASAANDPLSTALAAFLPMLMGSAVMAGNAPADSSGQGTKKALTDNANADATSAIPLFAPPAAIPVAADTPASASTDATPQTATGNTGLPSATASNLSTANLAATLDATSADGKATAKTGESFDALLADNVRTASAQAAAMHGSAATAGANAASAGHAPMVDSAVGSPAWGTEIGNHMVWMANNQTSHAELVLTPPQLGKIEISVTMSGDQATATFVSASPAVRDALENAMPRLREILADAGVTLGQTQVGSDAPKQGTDQFRDNSFAGSAAVSSSGGLRMSTTGVAAWTTSGRGLVDVFA
jgi:flagellar hook-length control protein FliK